MKYKYLDGVRGLAALIVVFSHYFMAFMPYAMEGRTYPYHHLGEKLIHDTPLNLLIAGNFAVSIFFVLSGIVLSAGFFRYGNAEPVKSIALKRYLRLGIPVFVCVMLSYALLRLGLYHNAEAATHSGSNWLAGFWQFPANLKQAFWEGGYGAFFVGNNTYNPVLWTMKYEFFGSFLVFIVLLLFSGLRLRGLIYAVLVTVFATTYYLPFILGLITADVYQTGCLRRLRHIIVNGGWVVFVIAGLALGSFPMNDYQTTWLFGLLPLGEHGASDERAAMLLHTFGAFALIIGVMASSYLKRILELRPIQRLGAISFPLYLIHFMVLGSYASYLFNSLSLEFGYRTSVVLAFLPTITISLIAAGIYSRYVDQPAISLSGYIYDRWFRRPTKLVPSSTVTVSAMVPALPVFKYGLAYGDGRLMEASL